MNEQIKKVVADGQALADKKSWLSKGYVDLLAALNAELKSIPDMDEDCIEYVIKEWDIDKQHSIKYKKITLDLIFREDAYLQLNLNTREDFGGYKEPWSSDELTNPATSTIRLLASKLADAFAFYQAEIDKRNMGNQTAIDTISGLIAKLQA